MDTINFLPDLFKELNNQNIQYSVLRNYEKLPESTGGSDLDLLVGEEDIIIFFSIFERLMIRHKRQLLSFIEDKHCPKYCIANNFECLQIDVFVGGVSYGKHEIICTEILFNETILSGTIKVLNPHVGSLLAFLKELLNNKTCSKKYIDDLQKQFYQKEIDQKLLSQFPSQFPEYLNNNLAELDDTQCLQLYQIAKKNFSRSKLFGFRSKLKRLSRQPGYTIAFLGTDGSGKSTIIEKITPALNDAFHNAVYYEHMRPNHFPSIAKLMGKKEEFSGPVTNPHGSSSSGFLGSLMRWGYYMLDYTLGFYLKIYPKKAIRSCVWIFDRYYYYYLIDPKRGRIKLPKWILKMGQKFIPEPDIIICLGTEAKLIHQRKPELSLAEVERQVKALKKFSKSHKRAVWIDTGKSIEDSSQDAMTAILGMMAKRFENVKLTEQ